MFFVITIRTVIGLSDTSDCDCDCDVLIPMYSGMHLEAEEHWGGWRLAPVEFSS